MRNISIWLDNYDDIFSDFDPRELEERNISDDFLYEIKKVSKENILTVDSLKLLLPAQNRIDGKEAIIKKRLHNHFRINYHYYRKKVLTLKKKGVIFAVGGMMFLVAASYISFIKSENFLMHSLLVMLEPAGWFSVWFGFDNIFLTSKHEEPESEFYRKLSKSLIEFESI